MIALWVIIGIIVILVFIFIGFYNDLVRLRNQVKNAWAQIDVQLKRRHDLIPNLVETVKGYVKHERETLESVTKARNLAQQAVSAGPEERSRLEGELSSALSRLIAVAESYPDLKANQNFLELQSQLEGTENRITIERMRFNEATQAFNTKVLQFPGTIFARLFGFHKKEYFQSIAGSEKTPTVDFSK
jgi:LemA protein